MAEGNPKLAGGHLWFGVENQYGHLSAVYEMRVYAEAALGYREDRDKCRLVHVRVEKMGPVPKVDVPRGRK